MKRRNPNLVNPQNWTPFKKMPYTKEPMIIPKPVVMVPNTIEIYKPLTRKELLKRNSFYLNFFGVLLLFGLGYQLYLTYLDRKPTTEKEA